MIGNDEAMMKHEVSTSVFMLHVVRQVKIRVKRLLFARSYVAEWGCESKSSCGKISHFLSPADPSALALNAAADGTVHSPLDEQPSKTGCFL